jgi:hypothetical protein
MDSDPISSTAADRRVKNLLNRLEEHEISVDEDAIKTAVEKNHSTMPPEEMFAEALQYGLGHKDPAELEPDTHDTHGQSTGSDESGEGEEGEEEEKDPIDHLAERPVSEDVFDEIADTDQITDCVDWFETPDGFLDIVYITHPETFEERTETVGVGDHSRPARAGAAVGYNWDSIKASPKRGFGRWVDELDASVRREVLSEAITRVPRRSRGYQDDDRDPLRESDIWPVVKERVSQRLLGLMQRSDQEYFSTGDLCDLIGLQERAVGRVVDALEFNGTITATNRGWVYSGDEVEFDEEQARFWQEER